jgi:ribosomal protein S12 methylthiotransferase accessory factor
MDIAKPIGFGPQFNVHVVGDRELLLLSEQRSFRLVGKLYVALVPFLDGKHTGEEIISAFAGRVPPDRLHQVLTDLLAKSYVNFLDGKAPAARQALWVELDLPPAEVERNLANRSLVVIAATEQGPAGQGARLLREAVHDYGIPSMDADKAAVTVVSVDDYLRADLKELNDRMRRQGRAWMPFKAGGGMPMLGPLFRPTTAPCWQCLATAMIENRPGDAIVGRHNDAPRPARSFTTASLRLAANFAALEIARALGQSEPSSLERHVLAFDLKTRSASEHFVRAQPDCPACGAPHDPLAVLERGKAPLQLQSRPVSPEIDGGWRSLTAAQVVQRLGCHVSPISGLISGLQDLSLGDGLPVFTARQVGPVAIDVRANRLIGKPGGAAGKGMSETQAKASCLAEAMERYMGHHTGREPRLRAPWGAVKDAAPHPYELLNFSNHQYEIRETWNATATSHNLIAERFDESRAVEWTPAWSLSHDRLRWLPTRYCYYAYVDSAASGEADNKFCIANSNGCASGSTIEEAILQGFFELVERDACALWWYNRIRRPAFRLDSPFARRVEAYCERQNRGLHVIDVTTDFGIPTAIAISYDRAEGNGIVLGLGTHLDAEVAISRALSEVNQMLSLDAVASKRDPGEHDVPILRWMKHNTLQTDPYCMADGVVPAGQYERPRFGDLKDAIDHCTRIVAELGHEMIVLDCSRPQIDFAVARVVVPGMRHFWARLGAGRLYQTPVDMGLLDRPRREEELNPLAFVF